MTAKDFRRIALDLEGAFEDSHHGSADFRVGPVKGKIFATLAYERDGCGVLMLTPEQQAGMLTDLPEVFLPGPGAWGRKGVTLLRLAAVSPNILESALRTAWKSASAKPAAKGKGRP